MSSILHCSQKEVSSCAALHPCAATDGTPGPGKLLSPTHINPSMGVDAVVMGTVSLSSVIHPVPPYDPLCRRWNRFCVSGVPTNSISTLFRTSGIAFSTALHSTRERSSFSFLYSSLLRSRPSQMSSGSFPGVYAWMTCLPSGASFGSSTDAIDTSTCMNKTRRQSNSQ